jgi:hypothetical protein
MIGLNTFILAINEPPNTDPYQNSIIGLIVNIISGVFVEEETENFMKHWAEMDGIARHDQGNQFTKNSPARVRGIV